MKPVHRDYIPADSTDPLHQDSGTVSMAGEAKGISKVRLFQARLGSDQGIECTAYY